MYNFVLGLYILWEFVYDTVRNEAATTTTPTNIIGEIISSNYNNKIKILLRLVYVAFLPLFLSFCFQFHDLCENVKSCHNITNTNTNAVSFHTFCAFDFRFLHIFHRQGKISVWLCVSVWVSCSNAMKSLELWGSKTVPDSFSIVWISSSLPNFHSDFLLFSEGWNWKSG